VNCEGPLTRADASKSTRAVSESDGQRRRGQVGIGTLIVFIAMVLVSAIAAGVLINASGFLQTKAEQTGQQSSAQTVDRVRVVSASAEVYNEEALSVVNLTVQKAPGSNFIDMENATVTWIGPSGSYNLIASTVTEPGADGEFRAEGFKDADTSFPVLNDDDDRLILSFDLGSTDKVNGVKQFGEHVSQGEEFTILITTRSGATTRFKGRVPESLSGRDSLTL
jgi:flagellin-like protein